ncbi:MAG: acylneuraminate cytidylyltransferase family protein [Candidatus Omnitrophica bacterium]|nr:acylneuraminate cytidylyltransferase family protein [Candidatus Omnitrophota bacterium]
MKPYILGAIFARGGSKGLPRKNIKELAGKPLIAYAIEIGRAITQINKLIVSTDDKEIAQVSLKYGAEVPFVRPAELARDDSPELLSWKHALITMQEQLKHKIDVLLTIPTTSPLRNVSDVENVLGALLNSDADIVVTVKEAERNPYFNMLVVDHNGYARLPMNSDKIISCRQETPKIYDMTTVAYAARTEYILNTNSVLAGKVKVVLIPKQRSLDIDSLLDFEIADFLIKKGAR